ncbi:spermatid maturation protein 1 [Rhynchocyon petersi]
MAIAEQPQPGWAPYHNHHTSNCQNLGNSILLLLGLIICINIGINLVTLLWRRLRYFLRQVFCNICVRAPKSFSSGKQTTNKASRKQSPPGVHVRCTMDPVKMTVTPPPTRRHHHQDTPAHFDHHPVNWTPDTDDEKPQHPAICSHNWDSPEDWECFQNDQGNWDPWTQDTVEPPSHTIRFQQTRVRRPLKTQIRSEVGLEAYVYPVNPPTPSHEALSHKNSKAEVEATPCSPSPQPVRGPALVPEIPGRLSSGRVVYDALDVRRRLRELTREVEALSHCYPVPSRPIAAERTEQGWVYRPLGSPPDPQTVLYFWEILISMTVVPQSFGPCLSPGIECSQPQVDFHC